MRRAPVPGVPVRRPRVAPRQTGPRHDAMPYCAEGGFLARCGCGRPAARTVGPKRAPPPSSEVIHGQSRQAAQGTEEAQAAQEALARPGTFAAPSRARGATRAFVPPTRRPPAHADPGRRHARHADRFVPDAWDAARVRSAEGSRSAASCTSRSTAGPRARDRPRGLRAEWHIFATSADRPAGQSSRRARHRARGCRDRADVPNLLVRRRAAWLRSNAPARGCSFPARWPPSAWRTGSREHAHGKPAGAERWIAHNTVPWAR